MLGKAFTVDGVRAVSGLDSDEVVRRLENMVRRELLSIEADPRSPERGQYGFVQALVRTVAYETMGRRDRKRRHLAVADHMMSLEQSEELIELIATHRLDAYRLVPDDDDADGLREQARDLLLRAAGRARSLAAPQEAQRLTLTALELSPEEEVRAELLSQAADLALVRGEPVESRGLAEQALAIHTDRGDERAAARVLAIIGEALFLEGRPYEAVPLMQQAYDALNGQPPSVELAELAAQLGRSQGLAGQGDEGVEQLERAIDLAERLRLPAVLSDALNSRGVFMVGTRPEQARTLLEGALRIALEEDLPRNAMRAYFNLSFVCECTDRDGAELDRQGLALARRIGDRQWERSFQLHLTAYNLLGGAWDDALRILDALRSGGETSGDAAFVGAGWLMAAQVLMRRGLLAEAREAIAASHIQETHRDPQGLLLWRWTTAALRTAEGDFAGAAAIVRDAREPGGLGRHAWTYPTAFVEAEALLQTGDVRGVADLRAWLDLVPPGFRPPTARALAAWLRACSEDADEPDSHFEEAAGILRSIPRPWQLAQVLESHAASLRARGRADEARARAGEAEAIYQRLGAQPSLDRVRAAWTDPAVPAAVS